jgi:hypothetical protein
MPKVQVLTQHEHGLSQANQPEGEARELKWSPIHLPYPPPSRRWLRCSAQLVSLVVLAAKIDKEKIPLINTTFQSGLRCNISGV